MNRDAWLPIGLKLPDGSRTRSVLQAGNDWQIVKADGGDRVLVADAALINRWVQSGLIEEGLFQRFQFGERELGELTSGTAQFLCPVSDGPAPQNKQDAMAFALAFRATLQIDSSFPLQNAIYVEKISRLLPTFEIAPDAPAEVVAGYWLTGGINVSATAFRRMRQAMGWLPSADLRQVIETAGFSIDEVVPAVRAKQSTRSEPAVSPTEDNVSLAGREFELPGRPALANFFNEHVIDIVTNRERYAALGIGFPGAVILQGPPGCGKTFAVDRLIDFLGWPSFQIDASSVASPYIHETSRKIAEVFDQAVQDAPAVLVIDEMEGFLADRGLGSGHHRVEEMGEFLRRIPEATAKDVLIIAMTNRVDMIDPAILRRGRFDHVIEVSFASEAEVLALVRSLLGKLPAGEDVDPLPLAKALVGRPLSDISFVMREGARLAARSGSAEVHQENFLAALKAAPARGEDDGPERRIGF